jgi:ABC-type Co2+ transport system permease subunit
VKFNQTKVFHPLTILLLALGSGALLGLYFLWRYEGEDERWQIIYNVPVAVVFCAFVLDRLAKAEERQCWQWLLDVAVIALALLRAKVPVPFLSGHALFLTYALLTANFGITRLLALAVLGQVAYLKIQWGDLGLVGAILLGSLASGLNQYLQKRQRKAN